MYNHKLARTGLLALFMAFLLVNPLFFSTARGDETFSFSYAGEASNQQNQTLAPGERHIYYLSFDYPDNIFDKTLVPKTFFYYIRSDNNESFSYHTMWGHVDNTSNHLENHSSEWNNTMFYSFFEIEERKHLTVIVEANGNETLEYFLIFYAKESGERPMDVVFAWGIAAVLLVGLGLAVVVLIRSPKYGVSGRSVRFSPQELIQRWRATIPIYDSRIQAQGSLVAKKKGYITRPGDGSTHCPHCGEALGRMENRFQFNSLTFVDQVVLPDGSGNVSNRYWKALGVYCEKCERLLGIVQR